MQARAATLKSREDTRLTNLPCIEGCMRGRAATLKPRKACTGDNYRGFKGYVSVVSSSTPDGPSSFTGHIASQRIKIIVSQTDAKGHDLSLPFPGESRQMSHVHMATSLPHGCHTFTRHTATFSSSILSSTLVREQNTTWVSPPCLRTRDCPDDT